jgi:hypothetical protein
MTTEAPIAPLLPTGKPHVSFSEYKDWAECSFRHRLKYVDKVGVFKPGIALTFGTAVHESCEHYLKTREMKPELAHAVIDSDWEKYTTGDYAAMDLGYTEEAKATAHAQIDAILAEIPAFLDREFPDWIYVMAEGNIYEPIVGHDDVKFKGFIDGIIQCKGKRGEDLKWIIDWKTSNRGWFRDKREDFTTKMQLILYKNYWSKREEEKLKDVRCAFVILKKNAKAGEHCELFPVSVGEVTVKRSLQQIGNMVSSVKRGMSIKNKNNCKWCDFKETVHCP